MNNVIMRTATLGNVAGCVRKGNFCIGINANTEFGETSSTGFWNGIAPPVGGYTIYLNKSSNGPSIYIAANDTELINLTKAINTAPGTINTASDALNYYFGQSDAMALDKNYEDIRTSGCAYFVDFGFTGCWARGGGNYRDITGYNFIGQLHGSITYSILGSGSLLCDGTSTYALTGYTNFFDFSNQHFTLEGWFYSTSFSGAQTIIAKDSHAGTYDWGIEIGSSTSISVYSNNRTTNVTATLSTPLLVNTWYYVTMSANAGTTVIYLNGVIVGGGAQTYSNSNTSAFTIGARSFDSPNTFFKGNLSQVRIYNQAITQQDVLQNLQAQQGRY